MKNKGKQTVVRAGRRKVRSRILSNLLIYSLIFLVVILGYYQWFPELLSEFLAGIFGLQVVRVLREYKLLVAGLLYMIGAIWICVRTSTMYVRYLDAISYSLTSLVDEDAEVPSFPAELKDVEIALRDVRFTLAKNEKMAKEAEQQKNDLLVFLAHDLKTPLTSVIGYLSLLQENPDMDRELRTKYLDITVEKAYRLEQLLNEFFEITRMNVQTMVLSKTNVDLTMMLYQIADEFYPVLAEKGLTAVLDIEPGLKVMADADKLARVFDNLLRNAVAYSYENTCVCIEAARETDGIWIRVNNKGDEIPPEKLPLIFEKFYRGDSARGTKTGGAGLGLAIAKEIVELHGGSIQVSSRGHDMEFLIRLPDQTDEPEETEQEKPSGWTRRLRRRSAVEKKMEKKKEPGE